MKRFRKLLALLLALAFCCALLTVSAMADPTFTYVKGSGKNLETIHKKVRGDFLWQYIADGSNGTYKLIQTKEFFIRDLPGYYCLVFKSSFLESIPNGDYQISGENFSFTVKSAVNDWPPATPTDLSGGSDEPDEVLYVGRMTGAFPYDHDPRKNPTAMRDIVENPDAVYGFSPSAAADSTLREYADTIDWSDPAAVAAGRAQRQAYHESLSELYRMIETMRAAGKTDEEIARAVSQRRNELRLEAYVGDPEGLAVAKRRNLETYGSELGPTPESLFRKYGSWQKVTEKALGTNAGMDACLGFYDTYYHLYGLAIE